MQILHSQTLMLFSKLPNFFIIMPKWRIKRIGISDRRSTGVDTSVVRSIKRKKSTSACLAGSHWEKVRHFMDNKAAREKIAQELARESLIGISYCLPDKVHNSEGVPQSVNDEEKLPVINGDGAEKYRSELMSISDSQSPDTATSPANLKDLLEVST
ncbi:hypothetical protein OIU74_012625 [Salix koriyanagi]|uniref:Uncharacterized protein n=2 Tax=Salix TaxID=40685 RepID=A0A9Q0Q7P4_9ROSI|nr:hypothetical protein OIU74_012625 [Salix koriyanagi]